MADGPDLPPGLARKVRPHLAKTMGYVLALREPCLELQWQETVGGDVPGRTFQPVASFDLKTWTPTGSWILGTILCPGDDLRILAEWATRVPSNQRDRIRIYHHPRVRYAAAARPWLEAGHGPLRRNVVDRGARLHQLFGRHHALQCYADHVQALDAAP